MMGPPPPTPTLVQPITDTISGDQALQLQEFARGLLYGVHPSTVITKTTTSGSIWLIERRFTYGEAAVVILLMALVLVLVFDLGVRIGLGR